MAFYKIEVIGFLHFIFYYTFSSGEGYSASSGTTVEDGWFNSKQPQITEQIYTLDKTNITSVAMAETMAIIRTILKAVILQHELHFTY